ncbi:MAG: peptidylprolyl isomerase, partial [Actinobacteria bacterium]|nr:peptidylprolyl isomerase [Actinomycetota bacterium]
MATKRQRQRQLARQAYERRMDRQARKARRTRQLWVSSVAVALVAAIGLGMTALLGGFSPSQAKNAAASTSTPPSPSPSPTPSPVPAMVNGKCVYTAGGTASRKVSLPPAAPDTKAKYTATITTNRGAVVISLLNSKAPCTVNSFVSLAGQKYFNNTPCHRLTTAQIFVLQCGDPTGAGTGGPGYQFSDENLQGATYPVGTVAMANSGPNTNGSQFFLVYKNTPLPPNYTPFGTITGGLNVVTAVAAAGADNSNGPGDGHPKEQVQI